MRWLALAALAAMGAGLPARAAIPEAGWVGTWSAAPQPPLAGTLATYRHQTLRLIVHASTGGTQVRIRISNLFGTAPLVIADAHIARRTGGADIDPNSDRPLTFDGHPSVTVPARSIMVSDPVDLEIPALSQLAISLFLPKPTPAATTHFLAMQTSYVAAGDVTAVTHFPAAKQIESWPFLSGVDVVAAPGGSAIVAFGDSVVDGDGSSPDADRRWPDALAARLQRSAGTGPATGVLNEGLIGNRLLRDSPHQPGSPVGRGFGPAGLDRFERDALEQPGVKSVIVRLGINDIGLPGAIAPATERASAASLIAGYRQLIALARQKGVRIVGATLSPFERTTLAPGYYTPAKESVRQAVNRWIRTSGEFDGVVDFDQVLRDPTHPTRLLPGYDSGDHLHPNDAGYAAMADAVSF